MNELLVYSPVDVELKEVRLQETFMSPNFEITSESPSTLISLIYDINGISIEFDTNLTVTATNNSLKNSGKLFFNSLIFEDEFNALESKGFNPQFVKTYNNSIDLENVIKDRLINANLDTNFSIKHYEVEIQKIKHSDQDAKVLDELVEELKSLIKATPFEDEEKEKMFKKINDIKNTDNKSDGD